MNRFAKELSKLIPDALYLRVIYYRKFHKRLNLKNPKTFNEKMQWLKIFDRNPIYTNFVDKYEVRKYISRKIGENYLIQLLGVWDDFDEIDFNSLPNQFVLKCTHDSGGVLICKDKNNFDLQAARVYFKNRLNTNYYYLWREWPYKNIKARIIAEKYIDTGNESELLDYKLMCFNGKVKCTFVCSDRQKKDLKVTFYDMNWNVMPFERHYPKSNEPIDRPVKFSEMVRLAEYLAENLPFVRVDFYEINHKIYFGELTFFPGSGLEGFTPEEWDCKLGEWLTLPNRKEKVRDF